MWKPIVFSVLMLAFITFSFAVYNNGTEINISMSEKAVRGKFYIKSTIAHHVISCMDLANILDRILRPAPQKKLKRVMHE
jgi:hypothetical protein